MIRGWSRGRAVRRTRLAAPRPQSRKLRRRLQLAKMALSANSTVRRRYPRSVLLAHERVPALGGNPQVAGFVAWAQVVETIVLMVEVPTAPACDPLATADAVDEAGLDERFPAPALSLVARTVAASRTGLR